MKKIAFLLIIVSIISLFAGCSGIGSDDGDTTELSRGSVIDGVYTNESIGLSFVIPDDWQQASEDETRSILNADPSDTSTVYDVLIGRQDMTQLMYVMYIDLTKTIGGTSYTADQFLEETAEGINQTDGITADIDSVYTYDLFDEEYKVLELSNAYTGLSQRIFCRIAGKYVVMIGVTSQNFDTVDNVMLFFTDDASGVPDSEVLQPVQDPSNDSAFTRGTVTDDVYSNEYLGIVFTAPEGWIYANDAELAAAMGIDEKYLTGSLTDSELSSMLSSLYTIYDMAVTSADGLSSVQLCLDNLALLIGGTSLSEYDYAELVRTQLEELTTIEYESGEIYITQLGGKTVTVLPLRAVDYNIYQEMYMLRVDNFMLYITISAMSTDSITEILTCFTAG